MRLLYTFVISCTFLISGLPFQAAASGHETKVDAEGLFEAKCSVCHPTNKPKSKKWKRAKWEKTVKRMMKKKKTLMTDEEAEIIIDYLAENYGK